jgi:hypothetical protein
MIKVKTKIGEFIVEQADAKNRPNDRISIGIHYYTSLPKEKYDFYIKDIGKFEYFIKGYSIFIDSIGISHQEKVYDLTIEDFEAIGDFKETTKGFYHMFIVARTENEEKGKELNIEQISKMIENIDSYHHLKDIHICNY